MFRSGIVLAAVAVCGLWLGSTNLWAQDEEYLLPPVKLKPDRPTTAKPIPPTSDDRGTLTAPPVETPKAPPVETPTPTVAAPVLPPVETPSPTVAAPVLPPVETPSPTVAAPKAPTPPTLDPLPPPPPELEVPIEMPKAPVETPKAPVAPPVETPKIVVTPPVVTPTPTVAAPPVVTPTATIMTPTPPVVVPTPTVAAPPIVVPPVVTPTPTVAAPKVLIPDTLPPPPPELIMPPDVPEAIEVPTPITPVPAPKTPTPAPAPPKAVAPKTVAPKAPVTPADGNLPPMPPDLRSGPPVEVAVPARSGEIQRTNVEAQVEPSVEPDLTGLGELGLADEVARSRKAYGRALLALKEYYQARANVAKLEWINSELDAFNKVPKMQYLTMTEKAGPTLHALKHVEAADQLYKEAVNYKDYPALPPGKKDYLKTALEKFQTLIEKYPDSDKISDAAFRLGEIYGGWYYQDYARAVQAYERCWQWDPKTRNPAVFNAAKIYDDKLKNRAKAVELYNRVMAESQDQDLINQSRERIRALTGK
jgi:TolA-binding protein